MWELLLGLGGVERGACGEGDCYTVHLVRDMIHPGASRLCHSNHSSKTYFVT